MFNLPFGQEAAALTFPIGRKLAQLGSNEELSTDLLWLSSTPFRNSLKPGNSLNTLLLSLTEEALWGQQDSSVGKGTCC